MASVAAPQQVSPPITPPRPDPISNIDPSPNPSNAQNGSVPDPQPSRNNNASNPSIARKLSPSSQKDVLLSIRAKAKHLKQKSSKTLRGLSINRSRSADDDQITDDDPEKSPKKRRKMKALLKQKLSKMEDQKESKEANNQINDLNLEHTTGTASIVIGATYSHSDNEMIDEKLRSMKRHKKSRKRHSKNSKPLKTSKTLKSKDDTTSYHADDEKDLPSGQQQPPPQQEFTSQFLKNVDMSQIKSSVNSLLSNGSQSINNFMQKQRDKKTTKSSVFLKAIPQKCLELWRESQEYEVNRFAKMSAQAEYRPFNSVEKMDYFDNSDSILWEERIMTDIIRAGKLFVSGEVDEIFEFPAFKSSTEKEDLVRTTMHYLESAVQETITSLLTSNGVNDSTSDRKMNKGAAQEISVKSVRQALISLCQEFVNDPYFKHLKQSCELHQLQPTDIGLIGSQEVQKIKSWTPRLCINITGTRIYTHIVRVFQCYKLDGIEAMETQIYFGFKRTYSIDCLGGPPIILPPIFLSHDKENSVAYQISIPKEKVLDSIYHDLHMPSATDFIPKLE